MRILRTVFCILYISLAIPVFSADKADLLLEHRLNAFKTMQAHFKQTVHAGTKLIARNTGNMALKRPGQFRWYTQQPMPQLLIADGKHLWIYDVDLEQVTVKKQQKSLGGSAALFLSGYNIDVARNFNVTVTVKGDRTFFVLQAKREQENFQKIVLAFSGEKLSEMTLYDQLDQITHIIFSQITVNIALAPKLFTFAPPKGVDIITE